MENAIREGIYILLKRMPVSYAMNYENTESYKKIGKDIFVREFLRQYHVYSEDEVNYIYDLILKRGEDLPHIVFALLKEISEEYLYMSGKDICCHQNKILEFRQISMGIGQHIFISVFESARRAKTDMIGMLPYDSSIIKSDDLRLKHILGNGIAENHFHLNGSAPTAMLSWICLMNHPSKRGSEFRMFDERRNFFSSSEEDYGSSLQMSVITAAAIRLRLYYVMNSRKHEAQTIQNWLHLYQMGVESVNELQLMIDDERNLMSKEALDYIPFSAYRERLFYPIAGEREFLVNLFGFIWDKDIDTHEYVGEMYAYLLIYCRFYGEMIQSNQAVGFYNFMRYQDRKEIFLDSYPYYSYQVKKMALEMALTPEFLVSLEARITPKLTKKELVAQQRLFSNKMFASDTVRCLGCEYYDEVLEQCSKEQCIRIFDRLFFVYHFVKVPDTVVEKPDTGINIGDLKCRHYELRRKNIWPVIWKFSKLRRNEPVFDNVYGLDACNREIGCRPEVFAPYFRFAREQDTYINHDIFGERNLPKLRITYHVGEDFLDVLDGLRAIEEAITFIELKSGDRIGHALALGVDVQKWYMFKKMRVYLNSQDALDNIAFLYRMIMEHQLDYPILQQKLEVDFYKYLNKIYPDLHEASIHEYILSMQLRGDEPEVYKEWKRVLTDKLAEKDWKRLDNRFTREASSSRMALRLINQYHYSHNAKYQGSMSVELEITQEYIDAVTEVQRIMCHKVANRGIGIECNLSSNILVGVAKQYIEHPILRFNHYNLSALKDEGIPEMFVSINTDDLGVFDTNLENEYALMLCALQQETDNHGHMKFSLEEIYRWLDNIRRMGIEQSFKFSDKIERK